MSNCCSHGTFLHFSLQSSLLNTCYFHQDLHQKQFHPGSRQRLRNYFHALLLILMKYKLKWSGISVSLKRHPFSGLISSVGELLRTPQRVPASMATVRLSIDINTFCGIFMSENSGTLTKRSDHPASPVLLTRNGPLTTFIRSQSSLKQPRALTHLKFENRSRTFRPQCL